MASLYGMNPRSDISIKKNLIDTEYHILIYFLNKYNLVHLLLKKSYEKIWRKLTCML
jgi:hypothetical protein